MRIRVGTLRKLIREATMSPSLAKNKTLDNVLSDHDVAGLVAKLETAFEHALVLDLVVRGFKEHYNAETRDFDDAAYEAIKGQVAKAKDRASSAIKQGLESAWGSAHQESAPRSGVQAKPAAVKAA